MPTITLAQLSTQPLKSIYLLASDDTLLQQEARDTLRARAKQAGFTERETHHLDPGQGPGLFLSLKNLSLFSEKTFVEAQYPSAKFDDAMLKQLVEYTQDLPKDKILVFLTDKLTSAQQKTRWYKTIEAAGHCVIIRSLSKTELPAWIQARAKQYALKLEMASVTLLTELTEGNLLATDQALQKLRLLYPSESISPEKLLDATNNNARFDVFDLTEATLSGQAAQASRTLTTLRDTGTEPTLVLWALTRELRELSDLLNRQKQGVPLAELLQKKWQQQRLLLKSALARFTPVKIDALLLMAEQADLAIKGLDEANAWDLLEKLMLTMALTHEKQNTHRLARRHL